MTPAAAVLVRLQQAGASITLRPGGKLWLQPLRVLTPDLLAEARAYRDEIFALLNALPEAPTTLLEAVAHHAAELLEAAERNPAIRITDRAKAMEYFAARATADAIPSRP